MILKGDFMKINGYTIKEQIGNGGFSKVYNCENSEGNNFAIKVPEISGLLDEERFKREIRMNATLDHENTMPICDVNLEELPYFFTMPLGKMNLEEYINNNNLNYNDNKEELIGIINSIASGLEHAHDKGVIHRDLKPQNIIIFENDGDIVPKICDFGAGRFSLRDTTVLTRTGHSIYSPDYCAPEQRKEFRELDERADIYSLGKIIYRIVTGNNPLDYDLSDIPHEYSYIISKACKRIPENRYQDAPGLIADLNLFPILFNKDPLKLIEDEVERIENSGDYSKDNIEYLAKVLSINTDDKVLDYLPNLPDGILRSLLTYYNELFYLSLISLDKKIKNTYFIPNGYADSMSDFFRKISDYRVSTEIKCLMIKILSELIDSAGQYSSVGSFTYIIEENTQISELMKLAKEILEKSDDRRFLEQFFKPETKRKMDNI